MKNGFQRNLNPDPMDDQSNAGELSAALAPYDKLDCFGSLEKNLDDQNGLAFYLRPALTVLY